MNIGLMCLKKRSNRFPDKHHRLFNSTTLFEHGLRIMVYAQCLDLIYICTDDERIWAVLDDHKVILIKEPTTLAQLNSSWRVIHWIIKSQKFNNDDVLFYLPCTAPLRRTEDIEAAFILFKKHSCSSLVSVRQCKDPPEWSFPININKLVIDKLKMTSQEHRPHYCINGSIYISTIRNLLKYDGYFGDNILPFVMPYERSIDVDTVDDFEKAEKYYKEVMLKYGK